MNSSDGKPSNALPNDTATSLASVLFDHERIFAPQYLLSTRKLHPKLRSYRRMCNVDIHPSECALILDYTAQSNYMSNDGNFVKGDIRGMQKVINVPLHENSDLMVLAQDLIEKYQISDSPPKIEKLLYRLLQRQSQAASSPRKQSLKNQGKWELDVQKSSFITDEIASLDKLDTYIELLYEDTANKLRCTGLILQLTRELRNLEVLAQNESLLSALSRVLREDAKRSIELTTNIIYIYFCLSNFSQFHPFITSNKVGDMCFKILEQESSRTQLLKEEELKVADKTTKEAEYEIRKLRMVVAKQDQLLLGTVHLLLNLADDLSIEIKMVKRDIVNHLIALLDRDNYELGLLATKFMKKLSVFSENKNAILNNVAQVMSSLSRYINPSRDELYKTTLGLLLNLSHDADFRGHMVKSGLATKLIDSLQDDKCICLELLSLLYNLSVDDRTKAMFSYTDAIPLVLKMLLEDRNEKVSKELAALAVNLCTNVHNAEVLCDDMGFKFLMKRALKHRDSLLLKILKTIATHEGQLKLLFLEFLDDLMRLFLTFESVEITVEILGILSSLKIPDFDYARLAESYQIFEFIDRIFADVIDRPIGGARSVRSGEAIEDDLVLECVMVCGTFAEDENVCSMFVKCNILQPLIELMTLKEDDDEFIAQILYVIYQLLLHKPTQDLLLDQSHLLYDRNVEIRKLCDCCLDIIADASEIWSQKMLEGKFHWHNAEWVNFIAKVTDYDQNKMSVGVDGVKSVYDTSDSESEGVYEKRYHQFAL
ncbi:kinesin-associated protein-domain-containing protein [Paraphysoderma sedebokerense]|nr:kinesin-associated protein-domain-containing protein [Paraphysoderma sedebokerense]